MEEAFLMIKIHYRNQHGTTNLPWQKAFSNLGELTSGDITLENFPEEIDHLHLGGSCKGKYSHCKNFITVGRIKEIQKRTNCSISCFYGDAVLRRFEFHHKLLDSVSKVKVYSAALYGTPMWRSDVNWVLHPTDGKIFQLVEHKKNNTVLFVGNLTHYRKTIIDKLIKAGINVDVIGKGGNITPKFGKDLVEFSKNYSVSFGMVYDEALPKIRYSSSRLPNALAIGLIYIETNFNLKEIFSNNEIIQWETVEDLIDKIKFYQNNSEKGLEIIMRGRKKVLNNWTFDKLAQRFLEEGLKDDS